MSAPKVAVLGAGTVGQALIQRLLIADRAVVVGTSKDTLSLVDKKRAQAAEDCRKLEIFSQRQALEQCPAGSIVFLAVPMDAHAEVVEACGGPEAFHGKVVVDVSNRPPSMALSDEGKYSECSGAENLARLLGSKIAVVKAFNTLTAADMNSIFHYNDNQTVMIAADHPHAAQMMTLLAGDMGFNAKLLGTLLSARRLEGFNTRPSFAKSRKPFALASVLTLVWLLYASGRMVVQGLVATPLMALNQAVSMTSLTLLAMSFLGTCLVDGYQLIKGKEGSARKSFPWFMHRWLSLQPQFGVLAVYTSIAHVLLSLLMMSPAAYPAVHTTVQGVVQLNGVGQLSLLLGTIALIGLFMGLHHKLTQDILNARERQVATRTVPFVAMVGVTAHVLVVGVSDWLFGPAWPAYLPPVNLLAVVLPCLVVLMRLVLACPCFAHRVVKLQNPTSTADYHRRSTMCSSAASGGRSGGLASISMSGVESLSSVSGTTDKGSVSSSTDVSRRSSVALGLASTRSSMVGGGGRSSLMALAQAEGGLRMRTPPKKGPRARGLSPVPASPSQLPC